MNPWLSVWFKPRQTIRQIVEAKPRRLALLLAMLAGAGTWMVVEEFVIFFGPANKTSTLAIAAGIGALFGAAWLYIFGWLYRWIGSWFGGQAKNVEVRAAIAWVEVLTLAVFCLWVILSIAVLLMGKQVLIALGAKLLNAFLVVAVVAWVWRIVLASHTLGEVHRFSAWKGLGTLVIANVPTLILVMAIPNMLRHPHARWNINDGAAVGNLRALVSSLEMYRSVNQCYPDDWLADMFPDPTPPYSAPPFAPPSFGFDIQTGAGRGRDYLEGRYPELSAGVVQGFLYRYRRLPDECKETACTGYTITATPWAYGSEVPGGACSYFVDASGSIRFQVGISGANTTDPIVAKVGDSSRGSREWQRRCWERQWRWP